MATTTWTNTAKTELMSAAHCLLATQAGVACTCSSTVNMTALASTANIAVGAAVTGTNSGAGGVVSKIVSATALTLSVASIGALTSATFTHDVFNIALIKAAPSGTYDKTVTNYGAGSGGPTLANLGTDEVASGGGYTTGGFALTNVNPALSTDTAVGTFSVNPSWTSATFSTVAAEIYNVGSRLGGAAGTFNGRVLSIHDFGGTQTVSAGTLTLVLPTANSATGLLRIA